VAELRYCGTGAQRGRGVRLPPDAVCNPAGARYHRPAGKLSFFSRHLRKYLDGLRRQPGGDTSL